MSFLDIIDVMMVLVEEVGELKGDCDVKSNNGNLEIFIFY